MPKDSPPAGQGPESAEGVPARPTTAIEYAAMAAGALGPEATGALIASHEQEQRDRKDFAERRARADALKQRQVPTTELDADTRREVSRATRIEKRQKRVSRKRYQKQAREASELTNLARRRVRDNERAEEAAAALAEEALKKSGIRHHYRPLPKLAFFAAYMVGVSLDRSLALRALAMLNVPARRAAAVVEAAFHPKPYSPVRNVCTGKRASQKLYQYDGRKFTGKMWTDGARDEDHPGAIRVLQVFIFLWLTKARTARKGYAYVVRGFGRGVYASICRCQVPSITGHEKGVPGAMRALELAGAIQYGQPKEDPKRPLSPMDKGPSGHAYNAVWFVSSPEERALEQLHERLADLARIPLLERLLEEPTLIEETAARAPPVEFDEADIPY